MAERSKGEEEVKPTWIFCAGTYRSGSTTQYRIARDIVEETGNGIGCGYHTEQKLEEFDSRDDCYVICKVFKCLPLDGFQNRPSHAALFLRENRLRALITVRNPLDIITSMMERHRRQMENKKDLEQSFDFEHRAKVDFPEWLGDLDRWASLDTLISRFEVFTQDLEVEVERISDFLGIDLTYEQIVEIASRHTIQGIMSHKKSMKEAGKREDPYLPAIPGILFGTSNTWVDYLTQEQADLIVEYNGDWMRRWNYL